jgi:tRNA-specific 2-thiouridylase
VVKKDIAANIIYVSCGYECGVAIWKYIFDAQFSFITENSMAKRNERTEITFKIRHTPELQRKNTVFRHEWQVVSEKKIQVLLRGNLA